MNEVTFPWWNNGKSKESLRIYSLLAQHNILARLGTMKIQAWKSNISNVENGVKLKCCVGPLSMFSAILPNGISFLSVDE